MSSLSKTLGSSPALARALPFIVFVVLTAMQGLSGESPRYWIYLGKTVVGAWLIWVAWPFVSEMKWKLSWESVVAGIAVFAVWVGLDPFYPKIGSSGKDWNPNVQFGETSALAWIFVGARILGSTIVVPPLEEVFYRSFLYRSVAKADFQSVPLGQFAWVPFLATSAVFGFTHREWLAGILCGFVYQGLVCWKKRLGDAMSAHAITNLLLGLWVVWKGAWHFW